MRRRLVSACACGAFMLGVLAAGPSTADDHSVAGDIPAAVSRTVKERFPNGQIVRAHRERDDGREKYELHVMSDGVRYEVEVAPDGRLLEVEREND